MKKQIIFPILAIAAIITGVAVLMPTEQEGIVTTIEGSSIQWTDEELIQNSPFIIKGDILNSRSVEKTLGEQTVVFTIWRVQVVESLKGDLKENSVIEVKVLGGKSGQYATQVADSPHIHEKDTLIMFLDKETDPNSFFGNEQYHIVTRSNGVYEIINGIAQHENSAKTVSEQVLKDKIKQQTK